MRVVQFFYVEVDDLDCSDYADELFALAKEVGAFRKDEIKGREFVYVRFPESYPYPYTLAALKKPQPRLKETRGDGRTPKAKRLAI